MAKVTRKQGESIERTISKLRRIVLRSGVQKMKRKAKRRPKKITERMRKDRAKYREQRREEMLEG